MEETSAIETLRHSASVSMRLIIGSAEFSLSHAGPGRLILKQSSEIPESSGEVVVCIDGQELRWPVRVTHPVRPGDADVQIEIVRTTPF